MKRIISIASVAVALLCLTSCAAYGKCGRGNSDGMEKSYSIKGFTGIKSELCTDRGSRNFSRWKGWNVAEITVYVEKSSGYDVSVRISDERYSDAVRLEKSGSNLIVKVMTVKPLDRHDSAPEVEVFVKMPKIGFIDLSGLVSMSMKGEFTSDELEVHLSGASTLSGLVSRNICSTVEMSGASSARMEDAAFREVDVSLYAAASAHVRATESLVTDVAKTASLDYYGSPGSVYHRSSNIREHK